MPDLVLLVLAATIGVGTLALILTRPRQLPEPASAVVGAGLMLVCGVVTPHDAALAVAGSWDILLFFLGLMVVAFASERAGVFDVAASLVARLAGGSARSLLVWVYLLGVLVTAVLSNDATALLLTPVVFTLVQVGGSLLSTQAASGRPE